MVIHDNEQRAMAERPDPLGGPICPPEVHPVLMYPRKDGKGPAVPWAQQQGRADRMGPAGGNGPDLPVVELADVLAQRLKALATEEGDTGLGQDLLRAYGTASRLRDLLDCLDV